MNKPCALIDSDLEMQKLIFKKIRNYFIQKMEMQL